MKILSYLQAASRNSVHHRSIPEHRQIEAVSVEGDELRKQLANLFDEIAYQLCLGSLANVRCAERVDATTVADLASGSNNTASTKCRRRRVVSRLSFTRARLPGGR